MSDDPERADAFIALPDECPECDGRVHLDADGECPVCGWTTAEAP
jgi:rubrerythrin